MIKNRICLSQLVTLTFLGDDVQELRAVEILQVLQCGDQRFEIMTIDRADVIEAEFFEQRRRYQHAFCMLFKTLGKLPH